MQEEPQESEPTKETLEVLKDGDIDMNTHRSKGLTAEDINKSDFCKKVHHLHS